MHLQQRKYRLPLNQPLINIDLLPKTLRASPASKMCKIYRDFPSSSTVRCYTDLHSENLRDYQTRYEKEATKKTLKDRAQVIIIMRPSSLGGGRILRRTLSVRLSVCPSVRLSVRPSRYRMFCYFTVKPSYERTSKIEKLLFSLMVQRHVCTFRHAQRAAYRTAISAAQTCYKQI